MRTFRWKCSWLGHVAYEVRDETGTYEITIRRSFSAYDRETCRPESRDYEATQVDVLSFGGGGDRLPTLAFLREFNAYLADDHKAQIDAMRANPKRYDLSDLDSDLAPGGLLAAPRPCHAIKAYAERSWIVITEPAAQAAA